MTDKINEALDQLDPSNPNHWTEEGAPIMDKIHELTGDQTITRQMVTNARSGFTRNTALEADKIIVVEEASKPDEGDFIKHDDIPEVSKEVSTPAPKEVTDATPAPKEGVGDNQPPVSEQVTELSDDDKRKIKLQEVKDRIKKCSDTIREMNEELVELYKDEKKYSDGYGGPLSPKQNQTQIQTYLKSAHQLRLKGAEERKEALKNIDPNMQPAKSKLDTRLKAENKAKRREAAR